MACTQHNAGWRREGLALLALGALALGEARPGWAQESVGGGSAGSGQADADVRARAEVMAPQAFAQAAHAFVRARVRAAVFGEAQRDGAPAPAMDVRGAHLVLRSRGGIVARGTALGAGALQRAADALASATRDVLPRPMDAVQQAALRREVDDLRLSVEVITGEDVPMDLAAFDDANAQVRPGLEGVLVTLADGRSGGVFPSALLVSGLSAGEALRASVAQATGDAASALAGVPGREAGDLATSLGARYARFRTWHTAELSPRGAPVLLTRGGRVVPEGAIRRETIEHFAFGLAGHLAARAPARDGASVPVTVFAFQDREEGDADPIQSALTAFAIARLVEVRPGGVGAGGAAKVASLGLACAVLLERAEAGMPENSVAHAAALVLAHDQARRAGMVVGELDPGVLGVLARGFDEAEGLSAEVPEGARGLVALALTRTLLRERAREARLAGRAALRGLDAGTLAGQMPWLGWALLESSADTTTEVPGEDVLREFTQLVGERQAGRSLAERDGLDLEGGILLGGGAGSPEAGPTPVDWRSARVLAYVGRSWRDARVTPEPLESLRVLTRGVRFLRQLCVDEAVAHASPDASERLWGVRNAPWDQRMSLEAGAMTLLTLAEALASGDLGMPQAVPARAPQQP